MVVGQSSPRTIEPEMVMTRVTNAFVSSLINADRETLPYAHWLLTDMFPTALAEELDALAVTAPQGLDHGGRRECNNSTRIFADSQRQAEHPALSALARGMRSPETIDAIERVCGIDLTGTYLRVEYCMDTDGFWLEPHTDIGAKRFTLLCYLSVGEGSDPCGTDIMDHDHRIACSAPFKHNAGVIFVPANDTWHGFAPRRINGVRKTLMINYVGEEWRARHELAFAEPVK
jgi:hypothetical protein